MAIARMAFAMRAAALTTGLHALDFPTPAAAIDLDFVARRYWWGGSAKLEANFTTFVLNGSTFSGAGLTPSDTIDVSLALAGLGTFVPGAFAAAVFQTGTPAANKAYFVIDDGTAQNRIGLMQTTLNGLQGNCTVTSAAQASINAPGTAKATTLNTRHGFAFSYAANAFNGAANSFGGTPDNAGTVPSPTTLRIGRYFTTATAPAGSLARLVLFGATKTLAELQTLSEQIRIG